MKRFHINVPATSANLGPGFDTLGLALDLAARVDVEIDPTSDEISLSDPPEGVDPHDNLLVRAYCTWGEREGVALPGARFSLQSEIPIARGLGSSAACIVAGLAAAAAAIQTREARGRVLRLATEMEGHPDNVAAALMGGMTVAFRDGDDVQALHVANHLALGIALFLPSEDLLTEKARALIPRRVPLEDAVFDLGRLGYLVTALLWGRWDLIGPAMDDRLHQPYRTAVIPALDPVIAAAREAGAYGAALSGGGPSVIALCPRGGEEAVAEAMRCAAMERDWPGETLVTRVREGGIILREQKPDATGDTSDGETDGDKKTGAHEDPGKSTPKRSSNGRSRIT
jgi:homoserine kinase